MKHHIGIAGVLLIALASFAFAQMTVTNYDALDFAYGYGNIAPLRVSGAIAAGGTSFTVDYGYVSLNNGISLTPLSATAPITIGGNDTVTPTGVSCSTPAIYQTCSVTVSGGITHAHGRGDSITSGTAGLQEAINYAYGKGGVRVTVGPLWTSAGGTTAMIVAATPYSTVVLQDVRPGFSYWSMQPSTLTSLAVPATLTSATATWTATVGTWAASDTFMCVTYVDALGGEGPCSLTYDSTPTLNYTLNIASPAASTGAVGYRVYAGTGSLATAYLLPITSANCTLAPVQAMNACAIGSNSVFTATFVNTSALKPNTQSSPTVNVKQSYPQGHTTFAYAPTGTTPQPFQTNFGPWPAYGSLSAGQIVELGTAQLPAGWLNYIGRSVRISGKVALTTVNTATLPYITVGLGWGTGYSAGGIPTSVCSLVPAAAGATSTQNLAFSCTLTVNATGATGTVMTNGYEILSAAAGGALLQETVDTGTAAITGLSLTTQDTIYVTYTSTTNATGGEQLLDLHIETLQ